MHLYLHGKIPLGIEATIKFAKLLGVSPYELRLDMMEKFDVLGPVMAYTDQESIEVSQDEIKFLKMLKSINQGDRSAIYQLVSSLAQKEGADHD